MIKIILKLGETIKIWGIQNNPISRPLLEIVSSWCEHKQRYNATNLIDSSPNNIDGKTWISGIPSTEQARY